MQMQDRMRSGAASGPSREESAREESARDEVAGDWDLRLYQVEAALQGQQLAAVVALAGGAVRALLLLNGGLIDDATALERSDILVSLEAPYLTDKERIETLFLATLSRLPSDEVLRKFEDHLASKNAPDEKRLALGDMLWALLNSAEFSVNH